MEVSGDIRFTGGLADCAEEFEVAAPDGVQADPGSVLVIDDDGVLIPCRAAYDRRAAGVVSGAGAYKPGLVLDRRAPSPDRQAIALVGKVFCRVDARLGAIAVGDLLTTSETPGHAMKASDPLQGHGSPPGARLAGMRGSA